MKNTEFDERQVLIRGKAYEHGFIVTMLTLLINAFLNSYDIIWADGFKQNLLILVLVFTVISVELNLRGAFFGRKVSPVALLVVVCAPTVILAVLNIHHFIKGAVFTDGGMLTDEGFGVIFCILFAINVTTGIIQYIRTKKQEKEK